MSIPVTKHFTIDARTVLQLGRESIKDHTTALVELIKNAYDADASLVDVEISTTRDFVRIADNGEGMSEKEFDSRWLRIGFSAKRTEKKSRGGRRRVGEKGVGRLSADRLGAELELATLTKNSPPFVAKVSWDAFDVEDEDISSVDIEVPAKRTPRVPRAGNERNATSGTELTIRRLRQLWTVEDVRELVDELSTLVSPFREDASFDINIKTDIDGAPDGLVKSSIPAKAELELRAELFRNVVKFQVIDRTRPDAKAKVRRGERQWVELGPKPEVGSGVRSENNSRTGPVELRLLYLPKRSFSQRSGLTVRDQRDRAIGVRIYRDSIRVRPYGDANSAEGDWLKLAARKSREPAGVSRPTYRIPPTELAGAVFIGRDRNHSLEDSAGREGLIHNEAFADLRTLTLGCLRILEQYRHEIFSSRHEDSENTPAQQAVDDLIGELDIVEREWAQIRKEAASSPEKASGRATQAAGATVVAVRKAKSSLQAVMDQTRLFRGLSTLGISASVFGHETQTAITLCMANLAEARAELAEKTPRMGHVTKVVNRAFDAALRVNAWGSFAVARVRHEKRDKPRQVAVHDILNNLLDELKTAYAATNTDVTRSIAPATVHGYPMDIEAVVLNLLTNAYTFAQQTRRGRPRAVRVELAPELQSGKRWVQLVVADSGPGVPRDSRRVVWEPLYTTKRDAQGNETGTGLGLAIVDSIVRENGGTRDVEQDEDLGGAKFTIRLKPE